MLIFAIGDIIIGSLFVVWFFRREPRSWVPLIVAIMWFIAALWEFAVFGGLIPAYAVFNYAWGLYPSLALLTIVGAYIAQMRSPREEQHAGQHKKHK